MWKISIIFLYLSTIEFYRNQVKAFNLETDHYTIYNGGVDSMFGYSVAEYRDKNQDGWIIVGAPLNETNLLGVRRGGAVYRCNIAKDNNCFPVDFDKRGVNYVKSTKNPAGLEPIDDKSNQWFGATISSSMIDGGPLMACAPKYHWFGYVKANWSVAGLKDIVGACWLTKPNEYVSTEFSPCRNNDTAGHHRQGMCQAGFSATMTKDGRRIFMGAPGSWYWQGQLFTIDSNVSLPFVPEKETQNKSSVEMKKSKFITTKEGPPSDDNNYLGFAIVNGDFSGSGDSGVAVGVPRAAELHGKVLLLTSDLNNIQNITGEQMGAYFGYALAANDIDGDTLDDLIITAPFFTLNEHVANDIETGRIYVFYQGSDVIKFQKFDSIDGEYNRGRFGLSVASLGDIDLDGYGDFVVGEPYGGLENRGAIYIYHGKNGGIEEKYSQVIFSEDLEKPIRTFGWSVSGGLDLDNNLYPDITVGAYESETVIFYRSRPVITLFSEVKFLSQTIAIQEKGCILSDGTAVPCNELKICSMYTGLGSMAKHSFLITVTLDEQMKNNPRLYFLDFENQDVLNWTISMKKDQMYCRQTKVYLSQNLRDMLTPLDAEIQIQLHENINGTLKKWETRDPKKKLKPILSPKNIKKRDSLIIQKNCGSDNICIPDLSIDVAKNVEKYLFSSEKILELEVSIQNNAEDAFESMFYLQLPLGIDYVNTESSTESTDVIIQCSAPKPSNNNTLRCDIGNPLPSQKIIKFKVLLQPIAFYGIKPEYEFHMMVNSSNQENFHTVFNNFIDITIPIWIETDLLIDGESKPQEIDFNTLSFSNPDANLLTDNLFNGPIVTHNYTIRNNGPTTILNIATKLIWTAQTLSGDILLYLIDQPEVSSNKIQCDSANADFLSLQTNRKIRDTLNVTNNNIVDDQKNHLISIIDRESHCKSARCVTLNCLVGQLEKNEEISLSAKYRINVESLLKITRTEKIRMSTKLIALISSQSFIDSPIDRVMKVHEIETTILPMKNLHKNDVIPLWIVVVSACAGTAILLILIYLLYKCGFFKRNRPMSTVESQPLNGSKRYNRGR